MKRKYLAAVLITMAANTAPMQAYAGSWQNSWAQEKSQAKARCAQTFEQYQLQAICVQNEADGHR